MITIGVFVFLIWKFVRRIDLFLLLHCPHTVRTWMVETYAVPPLGRTVSQLPKPTSTPLETSWLKRNLSPLGQDIQ